MQIGHVDIEVKHFATRENRIKGANYMAKYIGKTFEGESKLKGKKSYWTTRCLSAPFRLTNQQWCNAEFQYLHQEGVELGDIKYHAHFMWSVFYLRPEVHAEAVARSAAHARERLRYENIKSKEKPPYGAFPSEVDALFYSL